MNPYLNNLTAYLVQLMQCFEENPPFDRFVGFAQWSATDKDADVAALKFLKWIAKPGQFYLWKEGKITEKELFRKAWGTQPFDKELLKAALAAAIGMAERYTAHGALEADLVQTQYYVAERLSAQPDARIFRKALARLDKALEKAPSGLQLLYQQFQRMYLANGCHHADSYDPAKNPTQQLRQALQRFTQTAFLWFDAADHGNGHMLQLQPPPLPPGLPAAAEELMTAYLLQYRRPIDSDPAFFDRYWAHVQSLGHKVATAELDAIIRLTTNWLLRRIREGKVHYYDRLLVIFQWMVKNMLPRPHWTLGETLFLNASIVIGHRNASDGDTFCEKYAKLVGTTTRPQCVHLIKANLRYLDQKYPESLKHLEQFHQKRINNLQFMVRYHPLAVCMYYENACLKDDFTDFDKALTAYKRYIRRKKTILMPANVAPHRRLIIFLKNLDRVRQVLGKKRRAHMAIEEIKKLENPDKVTPYYKSWLLEKFREMAVRT